MPFCCFSLPFFCFLTPILCGQSSGDGATFLIDGEAVIACDDGTPDFRAPQSRRPWRGGDASG
jgi:hypothetical protein